MILFTFVLFWNNFAGTTSNINTTMLGLSLWVWLYFPWATGDDLWCFKPDSCLGIYILSAGQCSFLKDVFWSLLYYFSSFV